MAGGRTIASNRNSVVFLATLLLRRVAAFSPALIDAGGDGLLARFEFTLMLVLVQIFLDLVLDFRAVLRHYYPSSYYSSIIRLNKLQAQSKS